MFTVPALIVLMVSPSMHSTGEPATVSSHWLLSYRGKSAYDVSIDPRFKKLLWAGLPHYGVWWYSSYGVDHPLPEGVPDAISGFPDPVAVESDRYVTVSGAFGTEADMKGILWVDTAAEQPAAIFALVRVEADHSATFDLYLGSESEDARPLPPQFISAVLNWKKKAGIEGIRSIAAHDAHNQATPIQKSIFGG